MKTVESNGVKFSLQEAKAILRADWWGSVGWGSLDAEGTQHFWPAGRLAEFRGAEFALFYYDASNFEFRLDRLGPVDDDSHNVSDDAIEDISNFLGYDSVSSYLRALERLEGKILDPLREAVKEVQNENDWEKRRQVLSGGS